MAKKKPEGYLSAREARKISKANRRITDKMEKQRKRKNVPESEYLTQMRDSKAREEKYQQLVDSLAEKLKIVEVIKEDIDYIKDELTK